jgi:hypothetical protein
MTDLEFLKRLLSPTKDEENATPFSVGQAWFVRTVTYHCVGRIVKVRGCWLVLDEASWIADSGRFMQAIKAGVLNEVEPVGRMILNATTIVDAFPWVHPLPKEQK